MNYDDNGERFGEPCIACRSTETYFEPVFGFWKCEACSSVWGYPDDDPDYDELEPLVVELCPTCQGDHVVLDEALKDYQPCPTCEGSGYVLSQAEAGHDADG
jgi:DnaJ-class molecular chaperone